MAGINIEVDDELHKQFKAHCALIEKDIKERIVELMGKDIKKSMPNWMKQKEGDESGSSN